MCALITSIVPPQNIMIYMVMSLSIICVYICVCVCVVVNIITSLLYSLLYLKPEVILIRSRWREEEKKN